MQLKKIEVQGFKSFANRTDIEFLDGITTIVGPNGSGKSNIADALRWVLGEQSTKILRSSKMEDVIFAGTENRKKVGFAEVSIYLDNDDSSLPVDYREVVVTRRVFRNGESNYLLNGMECRLKDIQEIFLDTGIGKDGYSIIGQGKIDEILSTKSEDRRAIFEEASGIMKYRVKKEEAEKKLINTDVNLNRVNDILLEIENNIKPLEEKSIKAKKYLNLRDELKKLDTNIFITAISENAKKLVELDDKINTFEQDITLQETVAIDLEKAKLNIKEKAEGNILKIEESQNKYHELENETEKLNSKVNINKTKILNNEENIKRVDEEIKFDESKIEIIQNEIISKDQKKDSMLKNKIRFEEEYNEKSKQLNEMINSLDKQGMQIESLKLEIEKHEEEKNNLNIDMSAYIATIESNEKQLNTQQASHVNEVDRLNFQKDDIRVLLNEKNNILNNLRLNYDKNINNINDISLKYEKLKVQADTLKSTILTKQSKYTYLKNISEENEGYFKSVKNILDYAKHDTYGTVSSVISTDEKYEKAIEIALGGFLQNVIVDTELKAKTLIGYLKTNLLRKSYIFTIK